MKNSTTMYILCSNISPNNAISGFRFVTEDNIRNINRTVVRVELPDDVILNNFPYTSYYTTEDSRPLSDFKYEFI